MDIPGYAKRFLDKNGIPSHGPLSVFLLGPLPRALNVLSGLCMRIIKIFLDMPRGSWTRMAFPVMDGLIKAVLCSSLCYQASGVQQREIELHTQAKWGGRMIDGQSRATKHSSFIRLPITQETHCASRLRPQMAPRQHEGTARKHQTLL
ncbi:hypothetical protein Q7C36_003198 [Tachysurus vachellii]|uniref:Uncharacterized protein n=1 Tax=Tachysurus vachellii TaxID=175792 RepID=A0AA88T771_TACVA|nr:hypothetical protein Q7C36_003198 [Tachysurus vachellii]